MSITLSAKQVWRNFVTDGDSGSGAHPPIKADIQVWGQEVEQREFDTRTLFVADTMLAGVNNVRTHGYGTRGKGGAFYNRVGSEPSHAFKAQTADSTWWEIVPDPAGLNAMQINAKGDDSTDDATALNNWLAAGSLGASLVLTPGIYLTGSLLTGTDNPQKLVGMGWQRTAADAYIGTVLKANATGVANLLLIRSTTPASGGTTSVEGLVVKDFAMLHRGSGTGLKIDNIVRSRIENLYIECNNEGAIGMEYDNWGFFSVLDQVTIQRFTDVGLLVDGVGSQHIIRNCHIASGNAAAVAAIEMRRFDFLIDGGQYQVDIAGDTGIGILVNNTDGSSARVGGRIINTICEDNIAVKITGTTFPFVNVIIERPSWNLSAVDKGVIFDRATECVLIEPELKGPTGGTMAEWTSLSADCGVICGRDASRSGLIVDASATRAWMRVTGRMTVGQRASVTTKANLTVTCEDVANIGETVHNGTAWNKFYETVADDAFTSITPPDPIGVVEVLPSVGVTGYILAAYDTSNGAMEDIASGSKGTVNATDGTLTGTGGADGDITIRADSSSGKIYIANQHGASRNLLVTFRNAVAE